jgi:hypothetical protein
MKKTGKALLVVFTLMLTMFRGTTSYAASTATLIIEGLEPNDVVEIYRICNLEDSDRGYTWASAVTTWMASNRTGQFYADLTPQGLSKMKATEALEFCQLLLDGLKNTSTGVANLPGQSFTYTIGGGNTVSLDAGYYIVLPKGYTRVYDLKWFVLSPEEEKTIAYTEGDYSIPSVETSVANITNDRGMVNETIPMTELDDQLSATSIIGMPTYNDMYSDGKRVLTVSYVIPYGMEYVPDTIKLASYVDEENQYELASDSYSVMTYSNVQLYKNNDGIPVFFGMQDYFYEVDGNHLAGPDGTAELALTAYNQAHGKSYTIAESHISTVGGSGGVSLEEEASQGLNTNTEEETTQETTEETVQEEVTEESTSEDGATDGVETEIIGDTSVDTSNLIYKNNGYSVVAISLDTSVDIDVLQAQITLKKNQYSTADGWYDIQTILSYSVSPLDRNLRAILQDSARAASYGIRITACMGFADSYTKSANELLETAPRMLDDKFTLYKKTNTYSGDINEAATQVAPEKKEKVQLIYDKDLNVTDEYTEYALLSVNSEGQIAIGGIISGEYLIVQTDHVPGYALSELSFLIEASDWTDPVYMEGNCVFDLVWLDFKTVYLPATGATGIEEKRTLGLLIMLFAVMAFARVARKNDYLPILQRN